jgi:hypothetical protein
VGYDRVKFHGWLPAASLKKEVTGSFETLKTTKTLVGAITIQGHNLKKSYSNILFLNVISLLIRQII